MGLDLKQVGDGETFDSLSVGSYRYVHHVRAVLILAVAKQALAKGQIDRDTALEMSDWVRATRSGVDLEVPLDEATSILNDRDVALDVNYDTLPEDVLIGMAVRLDSPIADVLVGLMAFVSHSDCEGYLSAGATSDVARMLSFARTTDLGVYREEIEELHTFFDDAAEAGWKTAFV